MEKLEIIKKAIVERGQHAFIFSGPLGSGKLKMAKQIAEDLLDDTVSGSRKSNHQIDIILSEKPTGGSALLKIEEIKNLIQKINLSRQLNYRFVIIQSVERMTIAAANAFLKTLEEPPEKTIFLLTTNDQSRVPKTILSRCQITKILPTENQTQGRNEKTTDSPEQNASQTVVEEKIVEEFENFNLIEKFQFFEERAKDSEFLQNFLQEYRKVIRKRLLSSPKQARKTINLLSKIQEAGILMEKNVNPRLVLENLILEN